MTFWDNLKAYLLGPAYTGPVPTTEPEPVPVAAKRTKPKTHRRKPQTKKTVAEPVVKVGTATNNATVVTADGRRYNNNSTRAHTLRGPYNRAHRIKNRSQSQRTQKDL